MALPTTAPSAQGVDAAGLLALVDALEALDGVEPHGVVVHRHGARIAEGYWAPHSAERRRLVYSLSKTFTGTALALALGEDRLGLDDLVADHLPDLLEGAAPVTRRMRVRHVASMATGHDREMLLDAVRRDPADPLRGFFADPPPHEPGTVFAYNQPATLALATILQRLAGQSLSEYLRPRLVEPLGIAPLLWQQHPPGTDIGFSGAHTTLDAVARLAQLHLDDGVWEGERLLPEGWVAQASRAQVANPREPDVDWRQGYGFQLWVSRHGYRGDGACGQFLLVLPEQDAVVAIFSATARMQAVLDAVWTHLLPAMEGPGTAEADAALAGRLAALSLPTARERTGGGVLTERGLFTPDDGARGEQPSLRAVVVEEGQVVLEEVRGALRVPLGEGWAQAPDGRTAASGAERDGRLEVDVAFLETPHRLHLSCDPGSGTFRAAWQTAPLVERVDSALADLRAPA